MTKQQTSNRSIQASKKYWDKANKSYHSKNYSLAKKWYAKAAELRPKKEQTIFRALIADCEEELGNHSEALRSLRLIDRTHIKKSFIQIFIGCMQLKLSRPKLAERAFRKAIKKKPSADAYIFLGSSLCRQGRFREQKACYQVALRLEPNNEEAHYNLGVRYRVERQYKKAEKHLRQAIAIDKKYALAYAELGWVLVHKGLYPQARNSLRRSVTFDPDNYWTRLYLANANWHLHRLKEAEEQQRAALRINPSDSDAHAFLGDFLSSEQRGNGEYYLKKAVSLDPNNKLALYYMGKHYYRNYCDEKARYYLKKAARKGHKTAKKLLIQLSK